MGPAYTSCAWPTSRVTRAARAREGGVEDGAACGRCCRSCSGGCRRICAAKARRGCGLATVGRAARGRCHGARPGGCCRCCRSCSGGCCRVCAARGHRGCGLATVGRAAWGRCQGAKPGGCCLSCHAVCSWRPRFRGRGVGGEEPRRSGPSRGGAGGSHRGRHSWCCQLRRRACAVWRSGGCVTARRSAAHACIHAAL